MALIRLSEYRERYFEGKAPDPRTLIAQIKRGEIYGRKLGGLWFVDPAMPLDLLPEELDEPLHPLAEQILKAS